MAKQLHEMSDEEISQLTPDQIAAMSQETVITDAPKDEPTPEDPPKDEPKPAEEEPTLAPADAPNDPAPKDDDDEDAEKAKAQAPANSAETGKGVDAPKADDEKDAPKADTDKTKVDEPTKTDAATQLAALFAPFKANGREIKVESVEEARQLMQMGANYNKKMSAMKPHLATLRTLENAKIGEAELNFLIDVHNKVPEAINKLVKDSGIDPMDLSAEKADGYTPKNHKASDAEVELEAVLTELDGSDGLPKTLDIVSKQWDKASKQIVGANPQLLKIINAHVESGAYDLITGRVERERMLGRLTGLSDLEAYRQVGDAMNASGEFAHLGGKAAAPSQQAPAAQVIADSDPKKADDSKRKEAKRAVAPVKGAAPAAKTNPDFNPLSMSDEEFAKQFGGKF